MKNQLTYEGQRLVNLQKAEADLDARTEVRWAPVDEDARCTHSRIVEASGRVMRCSDDAAFFKLRVHADGRKMPVGFFCAAHAVEHGWKDDDND